MKKTASIESTADAYLELLAARGVDFLFANAGTDFAPLIEAYARRQANGLACPKPITVPHEIPAVAMAHGHAMVSGKPQAVMVHVIVGAANALGGIINAARSQVPILFTAGRTPITEAGMAGSRDRPIHWAQEAFDQGGLAREFVKWDYELRNFVQLETVVDRALAIARSEPAGPVYLTLPREVLAEHHESFEYADPSALAPNGPTVAGPEEIATTARLLAGARSPIILTKAGGRDPRAVPALVALAETLGAPVFEDSFRTYLNFPQDHPLHTGFDPGPHLATADVVLVVEADAPWFPALRQPGPQARIIQIGQDPLYSRYPVRGFPTDGALAGAPRLTLAALAAAVKPLVDAKVVAERRKKWEGEAAQNRTVVEKRANAVSKDSPIDMAWASKCVADCVDDDTIVVNEYDLDSSQTRMRVPGSYFASSPAGGLGWALGAALGARLAAPGKTVISCMGDGTYIFGSPTASHWVSRAYQIPALFVIFNNRAWNAVKRSVASLAKDGWAMRAETMPLYQLDPAPDYEMVCRASGGWGEKVEDPGALPGVLKKALDVVRNGKRQALVNIICKKP
ncbi:MAG TPA: thiamine pyrophosphate-requiring protein [Methylomirabilota bacterium]|nr:thiamine pyrophosphate-requiring protein [Methylomirabilota bacterium]